MSSCLAGSMCILSLSQYQDRSVQNNCQPVTYFSGYSLVDFQTIIGCGESHVLKDTQHMVMHACGHKTSKLAKVFTLDSGLLSEQGYSVSAFTDQFDCVAITRTRCASRLRLNSGLPDN